MEKGKLNSYPEIHFAAKYGWLNDPNGLVYHDGIYELYYQANPNGIEWDDMTWGHARSKDLLHWEELEPVMYPDENGMMFSGCGLRNDGEALGLPKNDLLFPYTAAYFDSETKQPHFTIRLAVSEDGGETFVKREGKLLDELAPDNRDPKVFWHEESKAYILVLWLEKNDMGIFRSKDFSYFELSSRYSMEGGFECPDLVKLPIKNDKGEVSGNKWMFWAADGSYVVGDFDGHRFTPVQGRHYAYSDTKLPYAAQTWSGDPQNRVLQAAWLRTKCVNKQTTGTISIPRELSLVAVGDEFFLKQALPEEVDGAFKEVGKIRSGSIMKPGECIQNSEKKVEAIRLQTDNINDAKICLYEADKEECFIEIEVNAESKSMIITQGVISEIISLGRMPLGNVDIIYDRGIIEVTARDDMILSIIDFPQLRPAGCDRIEMVQGEGTVTVSAIGI